MQRSHFASLIETHSWSTVKVDRNAFQFFYRYIINGTWEWLNIVKPPQVRTLPDILTSTEISMIISRTKQLRYQTFFLTLYSLGLRLGEGRHLAISDIDKALMQVHIRNAKGGKDRYITLPQRTLETLPVHIVTLHRYSPVNRMASSIQVAYKRHSKQSLGIAPSAKERRRIP